MMESPAASETNEKAPTPGLDRFDAMCPACNYNVRGTISLSGARCTECGEDIPFDALVFRPPNKFRQAVIMTLAGLAALASIGGLAALAAWVHDLGRLGWLATGLALTVAIIALVSRTLTPERPWREHIVVGIALAAICIVATNWQRLLVLALIITWLATRKRRLVTGFVKRLRKAHHETIPWL